MILMAKIQSELSMLEAAELLIKRKIKPQKFSKIAKEVFETVGISDDEDMAARTAQLYTDLSLSGKFVAMGDDLWDLKSRQKYETADYDTYELDFETEENLTLLGEDAPDAILDKSDRIIAIDDEDEDGIDSDDNNNNENESPLVSDDYGDDSSAEVDENENAGLSVYSEDEME